jgi:exonuclease VII large subunit
VVDGLNRYDVRLGHLIRGRLQLGRGRLNELLRSYALGQVRGRIESHLQSHDYLMDKLFDRATESVRRNSNRLSETLARLSGLDARAIMLRGYTLCSDVDTGRMLRSAEAALATDGMRVTFHDGDVVTQVKEKIDERQ